MIYCGKGDKSALEFVELKEGIVVGGRIVEKRACKSVLVGCDEVPEA